MTKKETSKKVASIASKVLRDGRTGKDSKTVAGSALSQREKRKGAVVAEEYHPLKSGVKRTGKK